MDVRLVPSLARAVVRGARPRDAILIGRSRARRGSPKVHLCANERARVSGAGAIAGQDNGRRYPVISHPDRLAPLVPPASPTEGLTLGACIF